MKKKAIKWEKIFIHDECLLKDLYPEYIKHTYNSKIIRKNSIKNWTTYFNRYFRKYIKMQKHKLKDAQYHESSEK